MKKILTVVTLLILSFLSNDSFSQKNNTKKSVDKPSNKSTVVNNVDTIPKKVLSEKDNLFSVDSTDPNTITFYQNPELVIGNSSVVRTYVDPNPNNDSLVIKGDTMVIIKQLYSAYVKNNLELGILSKVYIESVDLLLSLSLSVTKELNTLSKAQLISWKSVVVELNKTLNYLEQIQSLLKLYKTDE